LPAAAPPSTRVPLPVTRFKEETDKLLDPLSVGLSGAGDAVRLCRLSKDETPASKGLWIMHLGVPSES
jgi:hypothetical protein